MKATGRVNSPSTSSTPPINSSVPARPMSENNFTLANIGTAGKPRTLAVPNCRITSPAMIRRTLSACGDQRFSDWKFMTASRAGRAQRALPPFDLFDFVSLGAAGRNHLDLCALGLADQCARKRRGDRNLPGLRIGLRL